MNDRETIMSSDPFRVSAPRTERLIYGMMLLHSIVVMSVLLCGLIPFLQTGFAFTYDRFLDDKSMFSTPLTFPPYNTADSKAFLALIFLALMFGAFIAPLTTLVMAVWAWQRWNDVTSRARWLVGSTLLASLALILFLWSPLGSNMSNWLMSWLE